MLLQRLERGLDGIFVVEATLLLEAGGKGRYDRIVVVDAEPEKQVARAMGRGLDESEVRLRMSRQMDRETRLRQADYVIDNDGSMEESRAAARTAFDMLERDLAEKKKVSA